MDRKIVFSLLGLILLISIVYLASDDSSKILDNSDTIKGNDLVVKVNESSIPEAPFYSLEPKTYNVSILNDEFFPAELKIRKGDSIVWINNAKSSHSISSDFGSELRSRNLDRRETFSHKFESNGTFSYHCSIHPEVKARIIVE